jgi:hypothetical protein
LEAQNEPQPPQLEAQNEPPISLKDLDLSTYTHSARAREAPPDPDLPLLGRPSPPRCAHPYAHAWCEGRVHVPRVLHFEFLDRLGTLPGETPAAKVGRLVAFYAVTMAATPAEEAIGDPFAFWKRHYVAWVSAPAAAALSPREIEEAQTLRRKYYGRCPHDPRCATSADCVREIALARKVG